MRKMALRSINWVWSIGIFSIVMFSSETAGQKQVPPQDSFQTTLISTMQRSICGNPELKARNYDCFKGEQNMCVLPNDTFQFYMQRPDKKLSYTQRVGKMCTDQQYNKDFAEFVKCMDQQVSEWKDCRIQEMQFIAEMNANVRSQKAINDTLCGSKLLEVLTCYETVANKVCTQTAEPVFNSLALGDRDGICTGSAANISNTLFIGFIALFLSIWSSFRFN